MELINSPLFGKKIFSPEKFSEKTNSHQNPEREEEAKEERKSQKFSNCGNPQSTIHKNQYFFKNFELDFLTFNFFIT